MSPQNIDVHVNEQGRVLIPAAVRRGLGLAPGSRLVLSVEDGRLVLERPERLLQRAQHYVLEHASPGGSVVDELLSARRAEAAREAGGDDAPAVGR